MFDIYFPEQKTHWQLLSHKDQLHHLQLQQRREPCKNRWVSTERNDGTATGAVCDWSIPSLSKPFFSHCHVQSVDKRHHPTDSLINCEMHGYLLLSYAGAPQNHLDIFPFYPSVKRRNKLDATNK